jgi:transposase InsO family protein
MALIDPGKSWQNSMVENFNGKFRDECLSMEWFHSRTKAKVVIEDWRRTYNEVRPHSSLGKMTPGRTPEWSATFQPREPPSRIDWSGESRQVTWVTICGVEAVRDKWKGLK